MSVSVVGLNSNDVDPAPSVRKPTNLWLSTGGQASARQRGGMAGEIFTRTPTTDQHTSNPATRWRPGPCSSGSAAGTASLGSRPCRSRPGLEAAAKALPPAAPRPFFRWLLWPGRRGVPGRVRRAACLARTPFRVRRTPPPARPGQLREPGAALVRDGFLRGESVHPDGEGHFGVLEVVHRGEAAFDAARVHDDEGTQCPTDQIGPDVFADDH